MTPRRSPERPSDWSVLAELSEQLAGTTSLAGQRDLILAAVSRLIPGRPQLWLQESLFRLPDWGGEPIFPVDPPHEDLRRAFRSGEVQQRRRTRGDRSVACSLTVPLIQAEVRLGALRVHRPTGPAFTAGEVERLEGLARLIAVGLMASHRVAVERWRMNQLNLVRTVSAQIANVPDVDELARRVTHLIRQTFRYYYVAIFTLEPGAQRLRFRSSASPASRRKPAPSLQVELGQGLIGHVAASGEEVVCNDVRDEPRFRYVDSLPETLSEVVLPLRVEDRILGVLDVQSDQLHAFHPNDLLVLRALADTIALAVEGARLYENLRRRADQLALLAEVGRIVTSTLDLDRLMASVAGLVRERFGYPYVHLFTVHNNRRLIHYEAGSGEGVDRLRDYVLSLDDPQGLIPWVARNGQTVLCNDTRAEPRYRPSPLPPDQTLSELIVPLIFDGQVVGLLAIDSDRPGAFNADDRALFEALGDSVAAAIHNADLFRSEQWRRQVADSLREVAGLLSANVGLDQVLDAILTELERNLASDIAAIWLLNGEELSLAAVHGCPPADLEMARRSSPEASLWLTSALLASEPVIRRPSDPIGPSGLAGGFDSDYSSIAAPLHVGQTPVGVLTLAHRTPGRYGHEARAMTTTFASYAAVAIENARLFDAAQEQAYASAALLQIAQAVVSLDDIDQILATIVRVMPILVGVQRVALYLWDGERGVFEPAQAYGLSREARERLWHGEIAPGEFPLLDAVRDAGRLLVHEADPSGDWVAFGPPWQDESSPLLNSDGRLLLAVPLAIKHDLYGVLLAEEAEGGRRFRARRLEIIHGIAQQAALALQNELLQAEVILRERLEAEVQTARAIQQTFIPRVLPTHPGWDLAARWKTARQVGGDFYDIFPLPGERLGVFIADVADKGVPAALFMALTRTLVRAAVLESASPVEVLTRVNELLYPDTEQGMFVTGVYAVLSARTGQVTYANAGHNPPLWLRRDQGVVERLVRTGIALGVSEDDFHIEQRSIQLAPEDCLLLYTDGLTEAFAADGALFEEFRLRQLLARLPLVSAEELLDRIEAAVQEFMGSLPPSDDMTLIALRRIS